MKRLSPKEHQARYETDPTGLKAAEAFLKRRGYDELALIKSQRRHHVFRAKDADGNIRFLKTAQDPSEFVFLENEVRADDFLRPLTDGLRLRIPKGELKTHPDGVVAEYEFIEGERYADEGKLLIPFNDDELETLFQFQKRKQEIQEDDVPDFFLQRAKTEFADATMVGKLEHTYLAPAIGSVITESEAEHLKRQFVETGFRRGFAHHDFAPWNMLRDAGGKIVLTDPEHARWGMKWYDVAYNYLQTRVLLDAKDEAARGLNFFLRRFEEEMPGERIREEILHPLTYWTGACAFMATLNPQIKSRVREIIPPILAKDIETLLHE